MFKEVTDRDAIQFRSADMPPDFNKGSAATNWRDKGKAGKGKVAERTPPPPITGRYSTVSLIQQTKTVTRCRYLFIVFNRENASFEKYIWWERGAELGLGVWGCGRALMNIHELRLEGLW